MNDSRFLALPLDAQKLMQQLNLQLLSKEELTLVDDMITKQAGTCSAWGTGPAALSMLEYRFVFTLVLFYESKMDQN